jgi:hypothetical protein
MSTYLFFCQEKVAEDMTNRLNLVGAIAQLYSQSG